MSKLADDIIEEIIRREGGYVNDPADLGGPTKFGITHKTLARWRNVPSCTADEVKALSVEEARRIYAQDYVAPFAPLGVGARLLGLLADSAVNHGVGNAVRFLQRALRVDADGALGPKTIGACQEYIHVVRMESTLYTAVLAERIKFYGEIITARPENAKFAKGWMARVTEFLA